MKVLVIDDNNPLTPIIGEHGKELSDLHPSCSNTISSCTPTKCEDLLLMPNDLGMSFIQDIENGIQAICSLYGVPKELLNVPITWDPVKVRKAGRAYMKKMVKPWMELRKGRARRFIKSLYKKKRLPRKLKKQMKKYRIGNYTYCPDCLRDLDFDCSCGNKRCKSYSR